MMSERSTKFRDRPALLFALECIALHLPKPYCRVLALSLSNKVSSVANNISYIFLGIKIKPFVSFFVIGTPVVSGTAKSKSHVVVQFLLFFIFVLFGLSTVNWSWLATESEGQKWSEGHGIIFYPVDYSFLFLSSQMCNHIFRLNNCF